MMTHFVEDFPSKEPGRNDPCWCGSGRKYKKCHWIRASERELPIEALTQAMRSAWEHKRCLHPQAASDVCDRVVSAHSIQRSRILQKLTSSSNHVRTFHPIDFGSDGRPVARRVGWRDASTFTGFCSKHDGATFKPLEEAEFVGSAEQCFLLAYRAVCHEVYQKTGSMRSSSRLRDLLDRGFSREEQRGFQKILAAQNEYVTKGLEDFQRLKTTMDAQLLSGDYSAWNRIIVRFRGELCVASIGAVSPNKDMHGEMLQYLHEITAQMEEMPFGIVATKEGGAAIFTWLKQDLAPRKFVDSLLEFEQKKIPSLLVQFIFAYIENTYFSDKWWNSLSIANREQIERLAAIADPYDMEFEYLPYTTFVPWEVSGIDTYTS